MANLTIGISDLKVCRPPDVLVTYALGSCVGICLLDSVAGVGGLSHIMLPDSTQATNGAATPMRFADTAIPMLIREMVKLGASRNRIKAKIAGGAVMFATAAEYSGGKGGSPQGGYPDSRRGHGSELRPHRVLLPRNGHNGDTRSFHGKQTTINYRRKAVFFCVWLAPPKL